jgi:DNA polymerase elongation subunit (family B)
MEDHVSSSEQQSCTTNETVDHGDAHRPLAATASQATITSEKPVGPCDGKQQRLVSANASWTPEVLASLPPRHGPNVPPVPALCGGGDLCMQVYAVYDESGSNAFPSGSTSRTGFPTAAYVMSDQHCSVPGSERVRRERQPKPWEADAVHLLYLFGRTRDGHSIMLRTTIDLQLTLELPRALGTDLKLVSNLMDLLKKIVYSHNPALRTLRWDFRWRARAIGWVPAEPTDQKEHPDNWREELDPREQRRRYPTVRISVENEFFYRKLLEAVTDETGLRPEGHPLTAPAIRLQVWETRDYVSVQQSALLRSDIVPGAWVDVSDARPLGLDAGGFSASLCDLQVAAPLDKIRTNAQDQAVGRITTLSWDAEVTNSNAAQHAHYVTHNLNKFPDAKVPSNSVVQIAATLAMADGRDLTFLLELAPGCCPGGVRNPDGMGHDVAPTDVPAPHQREFQGRVYTVLYFPTERYLLLAFRDLIAHYDPDIIMDFNGKGFDWPYITTRMGKLEAEHPMGRFLQLGRLCNHRFGSVRLPYRLVNGCKVPLTRLPEGAKRGDFLQHDFHPSELSGSSFAPVCVGRIYLDICEQLQEMGKVDKTLALPNYTLKAVSKTVLRDREKMDFTPANIFAAWHGTLSAEEFLRVSDDNEGVDETTNEPREPAWYARDYPDAPRLAVLRAETRRRRALYDAAMTDFTLVRTLRKALREKRREFRRASPEKRTHMTPVLAQLQADLEHVRVRTSTTLPPPPAPLAGIPPGAQRRLLGDYCVVDTWLPPAIVQRLGLIMFYWQVARITVTPPHRVANGGQMYRVSTMFLKEAWRRDMVVNRAAFTAKRYKGATVLAPKRGYYGGADDNGPTDPLRPLPPDQQVLPEGYDFSGLSEDQRTQYYVDTVVATEDFMSLYPNIMRTNNLCPSTKVNFNAPLNTAEAMDATLRRWLTRTGHQGDVNDALVAVRHTPLAVPGEAGDTEREALRAFATRARAEATEQQQQQTGLEDDDVAVAAARRTRIDALLLSAKHAELEAEAGARLAATGANAEQQRRQLLAVMSETNEADEIFGQGGVMDAMLDDCIDDDHVGGGGAEGYNNTGVFDEEASEQGGLVRDAEDRETYRTIRVVDRDAQGRRDDRLHKYSIFAEGIYTVMLTSLLDERDVYKKLKKLASGSVYVLQRLQSLLVTPSSTTGPNPSLAEMMRAVEALGQRLKPVLGDKEKRLVVARAWLDELSEALRSCFPLLLQQAETWEIICDNRQKALKLCANSIYGVSGAKIDSPCACVELAESVTARGREMIEESKNYVLTHFKHYGVDVIYGDTDSVFCKYRAKTPAEAWRIAEEMAVAMTEKLFADYVDPRTGRVFKDTNVMEDESLTWLLALFGKKMYAKTRECEDRNTGVCESHQKGMPTVRRDKSPVLNKLLRRLIAAFNDLGHFRRDVIALLMLRLCCAHFEDMVQDRLPLEDYSSYVTIKKMTEGTAHMVAARKEQARSGKPVMPGMAVRYVYVTIPRECKKQSDKAELLEHVVASQITASPLEVDRAYYLRKRMEFVRTVLELFVAPEVTGELFGIYGAAMDNSDREAGGGVQLEGMLSPAERDKPDEQLRREAVERAFWRSVRANRLPRGAETVPPLPSGRMAKGVRSHETAKEQMASGTALCNMLGLKRSDLLRTAAVKHQTPTKPASETKPQPKVAASTVKRRSATRDPPTTGLAALLGGVTMPKHTKKNG